MPVFRVVFSKRAINILASMYHESFLLPQVPREGVVIILHNTHVLHAVNFKIRENEKVHLFAFLMKLSLLSFSNDVKKSSTCLSQRKTQSFKITKNVVI